MECGGRVLILTHLNGQGALALPARFADTDQNGGINKADVDRLADIILELYPAPSSSLTPIVSSPVTATNGSNVTITGRLYPNSPFRVEGVGGVVTNVSGTDGQFAVPVPLAPNRSDLRQWYR